MILMCCAVRGGKHIQPFAKKNKLILNRRYPRVAVCIA